MAKRLFDTSYLISHWNKFPKNRDRTHSSMKAWARELIDRYSTNLICTPVQIEVLAGTHSEEDLRLSRAFLGEFRVIDEQEILQKDWELAQNIAQRVPSDGKPRQLGDCLIRAIAKRFNCDVVLTGDHGFPRRMHYG